MQFNFVFPFIYNNKNYVSGIVDKIRGIDEDNLTRDDLQGKVGSMIVITASRCLLSLKADDDSVLNLTTLPLESRIDIVRKMTFGNLKDVVFAIKELSYGDSFEAKGGCKSCGKVNKKTFSLKKHITTNTVAFDENKIYELPEGFEDSKGVIHNKIKIKEQTAKDHEDIVNAITSKSKSVLSLSHIRAIKMLEGIDNCDLEDVVPMLSRKDRQYLQSIYDKEYPGKRLLISEKCSCGEEIIYAVSIMDFLFQED